VSSNICHTFPPDVYSCMTCSQKIERLKIQIGAKVKPLSQSKYLKIADELKKIEEKLVMLHKKTFGSEWDARKKSTFGPLPL